MNLINVMGVVTFLLFVGITYLDYKAKTATIGFSILKVQKPILLLALLIIPFMVKLAMDFNIYRNLFKGIDIYIRINIILASLIYVAYRAVIIGKFLKH